VWIKISTGPLKTEATNLPRSVNSLIRDFPAGLGTVQKLVCGSGAPAMSWKVRNGSIVQIIRSNMMGLLYSRGM
jgi:hypothetical protein